MNIRSILRTMSAMREVHPEMREPITWDGLRRVLEREQVDMIVEPLPRPAMLIGFRRRGSSLLRTIVQIPRRPHCFSVRARQSAAWRSCRSNAPPRSASSGASAGRAESGRETLRMIRWQTRSCAHPRTPRSIAWKGNAPIAAGRPRIAGCWS